MTFRQRFTTIGYCGIALAIAAPLAAILIISWSVSGIIEVLTSRYSAYSLDDYVVHPAVYILLLLASSAGWVMIIIGREYIGISEPNSPRELAHAPSSTTGHDFDRRLSDFKSRFED